MNFIKVGVPLVILAAAQANAGTLAGGHSTGIANAVGAKGVLSNPALSSMREGRIVDVIMPRATVSFADNDSVVSQVDDLVDIGDRLSSAGLSAGAQSDLEEKLSTKLSKLGRSQMPVVNAGADSVISINLPGRVGGAFFLSADAALTSIPVLVENDNDPLEAYLDSKFDMIGRGVVDVGLSLSYGGSYGLHEYGFGLAPKIQTIGYYGESLTLDDYELDMDEDAIKKDSHFNVDLGLAYKYREWSFGVVGRDLIETDHLISLSGRKYDVTNPASWSMGAGYDYGMWSVSLDVDLNEVALIDEYEGQQFATLSARAQLMRILALSVSSSYEMQSEQLWLGMGISSSLIPYNEIGLDLSVSEEGSLSATAQMRWFL